ncbi:inositol monophosphatase family protein [Xylanimonas ulmi]|uniref:Histidinol phosphatase-like enzyme (Inositol monophosphatase family) n=1 Tax=Xylanimonas ulmi TaxID=228973 RepID=A0A4Q7LXP6_9MICO|nr:inositol monophosphatase family protein [Xylanibacterium ulmi]RZS59825.1 histidinol phosphatase-like enzyme (inositol monophosphatase family) [Xylanibacterium ulmi]
MSETESFSDHPRRAEFVGFAEQLADISRSLLSGNSAGAAAQCKSESNPATEFDLVVESTLRARINDQYPRHGIVGEEFEPERRDAEFVWVLDPIDGTRAFAAGIPVFTTLIALCHRSEPVIGVIDAPASGDRWVGVVGSATRRNGVETSTRDLRSLEDAVVAWGYPEVTLLEHEAGANALRAATAWRVYGSGSFGFGSLASGALDIAVESGDVVESDVCALVPVVNGAGGWCTDAFGEPITLHNGTSCLAAGTRELHAQAVRLLNSGNQALDTRGARGAELPKAGADRRGLEMPPIWPRRLSQRTTDEGR